MNIAQIANATPELTGEFYVLKPIYHCERNRWSGKDEWSVEWQIVGYVESMSHAKGAGFIAPVLVAATEWHRDMAQAAVDNSINAMYKRNQRAVAAIHE